MSGDGMDEEARLAGVFREAAAEVPPPGFDAATVAAASRRVTRRRRAALAGGALAVLAVAGVGVAAGLDRGPASGLTAAGAPASDVTASAGAPASEVTAAAAAPGAAAGGKAPDVARAAAPVSAAPLGPGTGECATRQDPALRALVEQVLPEVAGAPEAVTTQECRPPGERGVALQVRDGASSGVLSVTYLPPGRPVDPPGIAQAPAAVVRTASTASGGTVVVSSRVGRAGDPSPFAGRLDAAAAALASEL